jgi:holo-ACP synthase CitX
MNVIVHAVLDGRDERRYLQESLFERGASVIVQLALNIPGYPKRMEGDLPCLLRTYTLFRRALPDGAGFLARCLLENGAGLALCTALLDVDENALKRLCVFLEAGLPWGRILDADVVVPQGPLSRREFGFPPRCCLLCEDDAKSCARRGAHSMHALRETARVLLARIHDSGERAQRSSGGFSAASASMR